MTLATLNGVDVTSGTVTFPLVGAWYAELTVSGTDAALLNGPAVLQVGDTTLIGTAKGDADEGNLVTVEVYGGAGGLGASVPAKQYNPPLTRRTVLVEALTLGGEVLSPLSDPAVVDKPLTQWMRAAGLVSDAVKRVVAQAEGASWRVLPDGTIWVGPELWPTVEPEHTIDSESPTREEFKIAIEGVHVLPGTTFLGKRVSSVEYSLGDRAIRATVRYGASRGGLAAQFGEAIRREMAGQAFQAIYRTIVKGQNADETLELASSDPRIGDMSKVPIRPGIPGVSSAKVKPGTVALVEFENGDESKAAVTGFAMGSAIKLAISSPEVVLGDVASAVAVALAPLVKAELEALAFLYNGHSHAANGADPPVQKYAPGDVAAQAVKAS